MATTKRTRATSSTTRSKKVAANPAQENTTLQQHGNGNGNVNGNVDELVRFRAYQLFEQRGCVHGYDVDDWFRAKAEVSHHSA
jgi:hypothetical protein